MKLLIPKSSNLMKPFTKLLLSATAKSIIVVLCCKISIAQQFVVYNSSWQSLANHHLSIKLI